MLMSALAIDAPPAFVPPARSNSDQLVQERVQEIFRQHRYPRPRGDRRTDRREPFPFPIHVTPLAEDGTPLEAKTIVVLGKHLSERGLDFYYEAPLPYRRVIVSWECAEGNWLSLLLDLRWCRSTRHGWYENGGRFLQAVSSPFPDNQHPAPRPERYPGAATEETTQRVGPTSDRDEADNE